MKPFSPEWKRHADRHLHFRAKPLCRSPVTRAKTLRHWEFFIGEGVDLDRFLLGPMEAQDVAETWLLRRLDMIEREECSASAYNYDAKMFLRLADVAGFRDDLDLRLESEGEGEPNAFSKEELRAVLAYTHRNAATNLRLRGLIHFALTMGWRRGEVAALEMRDLDVENAMVHCRKPEKKGKKRWLPVPPELFSPRRPFGAYLRGRPVVEDDPEAVWTVIDSQTRIPARETVDGFGRDIQRIARVLGFEFNFTRCRHTAVTKMVEDERHPRFIQFFFGWNRMDQISRYGNVRTDYARSQVEGLSSLWAGALQEKEENAT